MKRIVLLSFFSLMCLPGIANASLLISEIMYDLPGTDTNREWIEILNNGTGSEDITTIKFLENETNHTLSLSQGSGLLPANGRAIIAVDAATFLSENTYTGTLFDSSFSLSNTGESLSLVSADGVTIESVNYSNTDGAQGDGNALTRDGSRWTVAPPTPGAGSEGRPTIAPSPTPVSAPLPEVSLITSPGSSLSDILLEVESEERLAYTQIPARFQAKVTGKNHSEITGATVHWSFGDGSSAEGLSVSHTFLFPGEYIVVARAEYGIAVSRAEHLRTTVYSSALSISNVTVGFPSGSVELTNASGYEVSLAGMKLVSDRQEFIFPADTIVGAQKTISIPASISGLRLDGTFDVLLVYPNGSLAHQFTLRKEDPLSVNPTVEPENISNVQALQTVISGTQHVPSETDRLLVAGRKPIKQKQPSIARVEKSPIEIPPALALVLTHPVHTEGVSSIPQTSSVIVVAPKEGFLQKISSFFSTIF